MLEAVEKFLSKIRSRFEIVKALSMRIQAALTTLQSRGDKVLVERAIRSSSLKVGLIS
jgi:hypothetical protein